MAVITSGEYYPDTTLEQEWEAECDELECVILRETNTPPSLRDECDWLLKHPVNYADDEYVSRRRAYQDAVRQFCMERGYYYFLDALRARAKQTDDKVAYDWGTDDELWVKYLYVDEDGEIQEGTFSGALPENEEFTSYNLYREEHGGSDDGWEFGSDDDIKELFRIVRRFACKDKGCLGLVGERDTARDTLINLMRLDSVPKGD